MVDKELIIGRLLKLEETVKKLRIISNANAIEYVRDVALQDRAERNLQIAAQICIDIGNHIIADKGYRSPTGYSDIFVVLNEEGLISDEICTIMKKISGFRNILVHDYLKIDHEIVYQNLKDLDIFKKYAEAIATVL